MKSSGSTRGFRTAGFSGPVGTGKTSLAKGMMEKSSDLGRGTRGKGAKSLRPQGAKPRNAALKPEQSRRIEQKAASDPRWKNKTTSAKKI